MHCDRSASGESLSFRTTSLLWGFSSRTGSLFFQSWEQK